MSLEKVHILATNKTPEVLLDPCGMIKIKGRLIDESRTSLPEPVVEWIDLYLQNPADVTEVTIALEFLNSYNTIKLTSALIKISQLLQQRKKLIINWYYEEDDVDIFERGEYISNTIHVPIEFKITTNIASC